MYLALDDREDLPEKVLTEMKLTRKWVLAIVGDKWPLQHRHVLGRAVRIRSPYVDVLSLTQVLALKSLRKKVDKEECLCSINCCGFSHDDFSGLGRACRPRNGLNWMVLVSPPERTGKDYDQHAPSTVYPSFAAERGIRRVDRAENTCQRADGA